MCSIEERITEAVRDYRTVWAEPWPLSANLKLMVEACQVIERLEEQIHEDGGFIDQIVGLEEENSHLREENATYAGLLGGAIELVMSEKTASEIEADEDDD